MHMMHKRLSVSAFHRVCVTIESKACKGSTNCKKDSKLLRRTPLQHGNLFSFCVSHPTGAVSRQLAKMNASHAPASGGIQHGRNTGVERIQKPSHRDSVLHVIVPPLPLGLVKRVEERDGTASWQHKVVKFLLRESFQWLLVGLLLIDVLCVASELFLEARYPSCYRAREVVEPCMFNPDGTAASVEHRREGSKEDLHGDLLSFPPVCKHHPGYLDVAHNALRATSISILLVFVLELFLLLASLQALFFTSVVYCCDVLVVITSLVLDFILLARKDDLHGGEAEELATLLVVSRLWRFVRIGHGIFTATYETVEIQEEEERHQLHEHINALTRENEALHKRIAELKAAPPHPAAPPAYAELVQAPAVVWGQEGARRPEAVAVSAAPYWLAGQNWPVQYGRA